jgi:transposase InsO family protein
VERLVRRLGLQGVGARQADQDYGQRQAKPCPLDRVNRQFRAEWPNALWVSDFICVSIWQGFVYVAFVSDVFARCIVSWRAHTTSCSMHWNQALHAVAREPGWTSPQRLLEFGQYVSIRYSERFAGAEIEPPMDSWATSMTMPCRDHQRIYKAEVIHRCSWQNRRG